MVTVSVRTSIEGEAVEKVFAALDKKLRGVHFFTGCVKKIQCDAGQVFLVDITGLFPKEFFSYGLLFFLLPLFLFLLLGYTWPLVPIAVGAMVYAVGLSLYEPWFYRLLLRIRCSVVCKRFVRVVKADEAILRMVVYGSA